MKVKLNLNVAGIKQLAIQHGEKAAFGLGVLLLVLFIWSASKTEVLGPDKQPQQLADAATKTNQAILNSKWDSKAKGVDVVDYVRRAKRDPLNDKDYRLTVFLHKPLWELKGKRPAPKILPVEEMLASAGVGILALMPPEAPPDAAGRPPVRGGADMRMQPAPAGARGAMRGGPPGMHAGAAEGAGAARAGRPMPGARPPGPADRGAADRGPTGGVHISGKGNPKGFSWVVITGLVPIRKQEAEFEETFRNVIDPEPDKDMPIYQGLKIERAEIQGDAPPDWREIKLGKGGVKDFMKHWQTTALEVIDDAYVDPTFTMPLGPLVDVDWDPAVVGHPPAVPLAERLKVGSRREAEVEEAAEDEEEVGGLGSRPSQGRASFGAAPLAADPRMGRGRPGDSGRRQVPVTLFRFVDYTVEPAKQYRYRVKLRLMNPNWNVAEKYLKDPATRANKFVDSPWSEITPLVTVPRDVDVFAGTVVKASKEPQVKIMVTKLDREHGVKLAAEREFQRGSLANIKKKMTLPNDEVATDTQLDSYSVIVDILGGGRLSANPKYKSLTVPGEVLVLNPDGRLVLRDELDDEADIEANPLETTVKKDDGGALFPGNNPYDDMPKTKGGGQKKKVSRREKMKAEAAAKKKKAAAQ